MNQALDTGTVLQGTDHAYTLLRVLGQGSFGITYLANAQMAGSLGAIDVKVAVKEFFMKEINGRDGSTVTGGSSSRDGLFDKYRQKFRREAHNLAGMNHPGIVKVIESFDANGTSYIAMQYLGGGSLDNLIVRRGRLPEDEALGFMHSIGDALSYMHAHNMLHLDLKPSNVMLDEHGSPVIIDFGLSKHYSDDGVPESSTTVGGGTPGYAPLEQSSYREGMSNAGQDTGLPVTMDVYALGATLFKMLTGHRPPQADIVMNDGFPYGDLQGVSQSTVAAVAKAMAFRKADRFQTVAAFLSALIVSEEPMIVKAEVVAAPDESTVMQKTNTRGRQTTIDNQQTIIDNPPAAVSPKPRKPKAVGWVIASVVIVLWALILLILWYNKEPAEVYDYSGDNPVQVEKVETPTIHKVDDHASKQNYHGDYVDLGLPSGTEWSSENEKGYINYDDAVAMYYLPSGEQWKELQQYCDWSWTGNGYRVTGNNGQSIFLPAEGFQNCQGEVDFVGVGGNYWSRTPNGVDEAVSFRFRQKKVYLFQNKRCNGYSIRQVVMPCKKN